MFLGGRLVRGRCENIYSKLFENLLRCCMNEEYEK